MTTDFPTAPSAYGLNGPSAAVTVEKSPHASHTEILTPPLDDRELLWIKYCLFHNVQTLSAKMDDVTAQSLLNKSILSQGSGSMLNLPFHIPDDVWTYLQENHFLFMSEEETNDPRFEKYLENFRKSLYPNHWMA